MITREYAILFFTSIYILIMNIKLISDGGYCYTHCVTDLFFAKEKDATAFLFWFGQSD